MLTQHQGQAFEGGTLRFQGLDTDGAPWSNDGVPICRTMELTMEVERCFFKEILQEQLESLVLQWTDHEVIEL